MLQSENTHNKAFKGDSKRLPVSLRSSVANACHTLTQRYVYLYFSGLKLLRSMFFVPLAIRSSYFSKSALSA
ncbi:hypothetical protein ViNHUV68_41610 [Vibrio sp. NH-UV-68]